MFSAKLGEDPLGVHRLELGTAALHEGVHAVVHPEDDEGVADAALGHPGAANQ